MKRATTIMEMDYRRAALAALLASGTAACEALDPEDSAPERILFASGGTAGEDIYRMNADGTGLVNLTRAPDAYQSLEMTPDGRTALFSRQSDCRIVSMAPERHESETAGCRLRPPATGVA